MRWWWVLVVLLFAGCVALKLHGSSIGRWQAALREPEPIRGLVAGTPKDIRSDEWVVWTPSILSQARQTPPFPIENASLGAGRAPLIMSVPVAYFATFFRPQLWGFFLLDLERGFAWYWCAKVFGLLLAFGWMLRRIGIRSAVIVAFGSAAFFFSSFTQWWFSSPAMLPEMVASWAMCVGCVLLCAEGQGRWRTLLASAGLVFFGINFALCLYPPFQVPLLWLGAVIVGCVWWERRKADQPLRARGFIIATFAAVIALAILVPFARDVWPTLQTVANTEYPGGRENKGGGYTLFKLLSGPLGFFESEQRVPPQFVNISEASNFYPLWMFALFAAVIARFRRAIPLPPLVVALPVFIIAISIFCTVELPQWLLRATFFAHVHEARALLALGVANVVVVCVFLDRYRNRILGLWWSLAGAFVAAAAIGALFFAARQLAAPFLADKSWVALVIGANTLIVALFFFEPARRWFLLAFAALLISSNGLVNPIMRGLGPITGSAAYAEISKLHAADPQAKWIAYGDHVTGQFIKTTGATVLNGTKIVPDLEFWRQLDPAGAFDSVYNRYAWIICVPRVFPEEVRFELLQMEFYSVDLPPGLKPLRDAGYDYYVFPQQWHDAIFYDFGLASETAGQRLWIYRRDR